jgi:MFS family permease
MPVVTTDTSRPALPVLLGGLAVFYLLQGLPAGLLAKALPSLAREAGLSREWIGLLGLTALPWALKFLWAPWVDRCGRGARAHRKRWILGCQWGVVALVLLLSLWPRDVWFGPLLGCLLLVLFFINAACATQDIAADGLAVRLLTPALRGPGNSVQVLAYKVGMIVSGAALLMANDWLGWRVTLWLLALLIVLLLIPVARFPEPMEPDARAWRAERGWWWRSLRDFWRRPGLGPWALLLLGYKIGDGFGSRMIKPFLVDGGWSQAAIGRLDLLTGLAGLAAAGLGGVLMLRLSRRAALIGFGALQALAFVGWWWVARHAGAGVWPVALFEQIADGLSTVALFVVMMDYCRAGREGSDYTVQASMQLLAVGVFTLGSGFSASALGYADHFLLAAALGGLVIMAALFWRPPVAMAPADRAMPIL